MTEHLAQAVRVAVEHFSASTAAVPSVRAAATRHLRAWRLGSQAAESAELVVSELVTNAAKISDGEDVGVLWLTLTGSMLVVEVWDGSDIPPAPTTPGPDDENGRGLLLVDALSLRWSWYLPATGGKVVWAILAADVQAIRHDSHTHAAALPTRSSVPGPSTLRPATFEDDPLLLRRVLDGLRGFNTWPPDLHCIRRDADATPHPRAGTGQATSAVGVVHLPLRHRARQRLQGHRPAGQRGMSD